MATIDTNTTTTINSIVFTTITIQTDHDTIVTNSNGTVSDIDTTTGILVVVVVVLK